VIKIRYADLPGGLHVRAVAQGKDTIVYLVPGLTVAQRQAALRRVRSSARMGHGPPLSTAGLAYALMADRMRTTVRNAAAAMRVHPAMFVPLIVILLSAAIAYFALTSVSIKVRSPQASAPQTALGPPTAVAAGPSRGSEPRHPSQPGGLAPGWPSPVRSGAPTPKEPGGGDPSPGPLPSPAPSVDPGPTGPGQPPFPVPSPVPSPVPFPVPSPSPSPSPSPTGSGSGSGSGGGLCVNVGPLGVCLTL
jgi:hypothetical protein